MALTSDSNSIPLPYNSFCSITNRDLLSEFDYWQFWRNTADSDVVRFLKLFTEVPLTELAIIENWKGSELNAAKILLADEATRLLHGNDCLAQIHATVDSLFAGGSGGAELESLPKFTVSEGSMSVVDLLVLAGMSTSKGEAKRLIKGGGARINDEKVTSESAMVALADFGTESRLKLSSGKKSHCLIVLN